MPEPVTMGVGYFVFTGAVAIGAGVTGYFMRKELEKERARQQARQERLRRERQERDRQAREAANNTAIRIGNDADAIIARMREKQQHFSGLISSLNTAIIGNQHSTDELQGIISTMQENLTDLISSTEAMTNELTQLRDKLKSLTEDLEATRNQLAEKDRMMRDAVNSITRRTEGLSLRANQSIEELQYQVEGIDLQSPQYPEVMALRTELSKYVRQSQLDQQKIADLTEVNRRQSTLIAKFSPDSVSTRFSKESSPVQPSRLQRPKTGTLFDRQRRHSPTSDLDTSKKLSSSLPTKFGGSFN